MMYDHPDSDLRIQVTGDRSRGRLLVICDGAPLWLTVNQFTVLTILVHKRLTTQTGFAAGDPLGEIVINPVSILRLRRAVGADLIETGISCEYRLRAEPSEIAISESFEELPDGIISPELKTELAGFIRTSVK